MNNLDYELLKFHTLIDCDFFLWNRYMHKRDMSAEMIFRMVMIRHWDNKKTTVKDIEFYSGLSNNTIRKKLEFLEKHYACIEKVTYEKDKRNTIVVPTDIGIRTTEIHTARMLKTMIKISPLANTLINDIAEEHFKQTNTQKHPAYSFNFADVINYYNNVEITRKQYTQKIHAITEDKKSVQN